MANSYIVGHGPVVVKRFILTEGSGFTIPPNSSILYSEVVVNSDGDEILEVWLAVPTTTDPHGRIGQATTIFNKTTVYEDDDDLDGDMAMLDADDDDFIDEAAMRRRIEQNVNRNLEDDDYEY